MTKAQIVDAGRIESARYYLSDLRIERKVAPLGGNEWSHIDGQIRAIERTLTILGIPLR